MSRLSRWLVVICSVSVSVVGWAQQGGIRGTVMDKDFEVPLPGVKVRISESGQEVISSDSGAFFVESMEAGAYTVIFSKDGYTRSIQSDVVVVPGQLTDLEREMEGEYEEMDELVVRDIQLGGASEIGLLNLRLESSSMMDSVGADLMSKAGASDAAQALRLVAGATVQDGKYAVVRGLPDRYVSSQMNGVRLPTADVDKRAVQLDQFPSAMIESIQVSKTFTPDQQGDASGGAVNVVLKGVPDQRVLKGGFSLEANSQVLEAKNDFLTYEGGGVNAFGLDAENRAPQPSGTAWTGAVGVSRDDAPFSYKLGVTAGDKVELDSGIKVGAVGSFFYKRDASYYKGGVEDDYWITNPGASFSPQYEQGTPQQGEFYTSLYDVEKGVDEVQWGVLGGLGIESENHSLNLLYSMTHSAEDKAVLQENTRGKQWFYPGHDPADQTSPGHYNAPSGSNELDGSPYTRNETLEYTERDTSTLQLRGDHVLPLPEWGAAGVFWMLAPEVDWTLAMSGSELDSPDKRQFGTTWFPGYEVPGQWYGSYYVPGTTNAATHRAKLESANINLGNLNRIWKTVSEESEQYFVNMKFPFEQWSEDEGFFKVGIFEDQVDREYRQQSFSNTGAQGLAYEGDWNQFWSAAFPSEGHVISENNIDVGYDGTQAISAFYYMMDLPLASFLKFTGGARMEKTELSIENFAESDVKWYPGGVETDLNPGDADVDFAQRDVLPSLGLELKPVEQVVLRGSYSETVARQTFKELTPILQQEYLGADVFIGNPDLQMSALKNYDLRLDYNPYPGGLISVSWFYKDIDQPIEYVQQLFSSFNGTTAVNYPEGTMNGYEFEIRQSLGHFWDPLEGFSVGGNVTLIQSEVTLPEEEQNELAQPNLQVYRESRDMLNAPEYLYNVNLTYSVKPWGSEWGLFYSVKGDTLVAGGGNSDGNYVADIYETEVGTLNFTWAQQLGEHWKAIFKAKNLLDPKIERIYRHEGQEQLHSSYTKGIDYSIGVTTSW